MKAEVFLPDDYRPAEDEPFMNERQLEYFLTGQYSAANRHAMG